MVQRSIIIKSYPHPLFPNFIYQKFKATSQNSFRPAPPDMSPGISETVQWECTILARWRVVWILCQRVWGCFASCVAIVRLVVSLRTLWRTVSLEACSFPVCFCLSALCNCSLSMHISYEVASETPQKQRVLSSLKMLSLDLVIFRLSHTFGSDRFIYFSLSFMV